MITIQMMKRQFYEDEKNGIIISRKYFWRLQKYSQCIHCIFTYLPLTKVQSPLCVLQCQKIVQLLANSPLHQSTKIPSLPLEIFYSKLETIFWPQGPSLGLLSDLTCKRTLGLLNNFTKISMKVWFYVVFSML